MLDLLRKPLGFKRTFTVADAGRICIDRLKARGATDYIFVNVGIWDGLGGEEGRRKHGEVARKIVDQRCPDVAEFIDPDLSDWNTGRLAFLIPKPSSSADQQ